MDLDDRPMNGDAGSSNDFQEDGFDPGNCSKDEKIAYLWQLYLQTETDLNAALKNAEQQRQQHADEIKEVEVYVAHIRALSDEREALTLELEAENERLRKRTEQSAEVAELLAQQGVNEVVATMAPAEQLVYLLLERARLMDDLQSKQTAENLESSWMLDEALKEKLLQEQAKMELDFEHERDNLSKQMSAFLDDHIREMDQLLQEKEQADNQLIEANRKMNELREELQHWQPENDAVLDGSAELEMAGGTTEFVDSPALRNALAENCKLVDQLAAVTSELIKQRSEYATLRAEVQRTERIEQEALELDVLQGDGHKEGKELMETMQARSVAEEKLAEMEQELKDVSVKLADGYRKNAENDKDIYQTAAEIKGLKGQVMALTEALSVVQKENDNLKKSLSKIQNEGILEATKEENHNLQQELASTTARHELQMKEHVEIMRGIMEQVEDDNKDLNKKLHEAYFRCEQAERLLRKEKLRSKELNSRSNSGVEQVKEYCETVEREISQLQKRLPASRTSSPDLLALKMEMVQIRLQHRREMDDLHLKLQQTELERELLKESLTNRQEELQILHSGDSKLQTSLAAETRHRKQSEDRSQHLESEMNKLWDRLRDTLEANGKLELEKCSLQEEFDQLQSMMRNETMQSCVRETDRSKYLELAHSRVVNAEKQIIELKSNLEVVNSHLTDAEEQVVELSALGEEAALLANDANQLRLQLHEEHRSRLIEANMTDDLRKHLALSQDCEMRLRKQLRDFQYALADNETKLNSAQEESKNYCQMLEVSERTRRALARRVDLCEQEIDALQLELLVANEKLQLRIEKYVERREHHREKLLRAREIFNSVKLKLREKVTILEVELKRAQETLNFDTVQQVQANGGYHSVFRERQEVHARHHSQDAPLHRSLPDGTPLYEVVQSLSQHQTSTQSSGKKSSPLSKIAERARQDRLSTTDERLMEITNRTSPRQRLAHIPGQLSEVESTLSSGLGGSTLSWTPSCQVKAVTSHSSLESLSA